MMRDDIAYKELSMLGVGWVTYEDENDNVAWVEPWLRLMRLPGVLRMGTTRQYDLKCFRCGVERRFRFEELLHETESVGRRAALVIDPHRKCKRKVDDVFREPVEVVAGHVVPSAPLSHDLDKLFTVRVAAAVAPILRRLKP